MNESGKLSSHNGTDQADDGAVTATLESSLVRVAAKWSLSTLTLTLTREQPNGGAPLQMALNLKPLLNERAAGAVNTFFEHPERLARTGPVSA